MENDLIILIYYSRWNSFLSLWNTIINDGRTINPNSYLKISRNNVPAGFTMLGAAAFNGGSFFVNFLMSKNANVNYKAPGGTRPLTLAIQAGHDAIVDLLLKKYQAETNYGDNGNTPLLLATKLANKKAIISLLNSGADPNWMRLSSRVITLPLIIAPNREIGDVFLIQSNALINKTDYRNYNALGYAVALYLNKRYRFIKNSFNLLTLGINSLNNNSINIAYRRVLYYLRWGANPDWNIVHLPLLAAVSAGDIEMVKLLCEWGAHPSTKGHLIEFKPYILSNILKFKKCRRIVSPLEWVQEMVVEQEAYTLLLKNDTNVPLSEQKLLLTKKQQYINSKHILGILRKYYYVYQTPLKDLLSLEEKAYGRLRKIAIAAGILVPKNEKLILKIKRQEFLPTKEVLPSNVYQKVIKRIEKSKGKYLKSKSIYIKQCENDSLENGIKLNRIDQTTIVSLNDDKCVCSCFAYENIVHLNPFNKDRKTLIDYWEPVLPNTPFLIDQMNPLPPKDLKQIGVEELSRIVFEVNPFMNVKILIEAIPTNIWYSLAQKYKLWNITEKITREQKALSVITFWVRAAKNLKITPGFIVVEIEKITKNSKIYNRNVDISLVQNEKITSDLTSQLNVLSKLSKNLPASDPVRKSLQEAEIITEKIINQPYSNNTKNIILNNNNQISLAKERILQLENQKREKKQKERLVKEKNLEQLILTAEKPLERQELINEKLLNKEIMNQKIFNLRRRLQKSEIPKFILK